MNNNEKFIKIPILSTDEVTELGRIMHEQKEDEFALKRFWEEVHEKRGQKYKQVFTKGEIQNGN